MPQTKRTKQTAAETAALAKLVDELGSIEKELAPLAGKMKRAELLRRAIREQAPETASQIDGERFVAMLGEHGMRTLVNYAELVKRIGATAYAKFATATISDLEKNVAAGHLAFVLSQEQTGPRSLKVVERGA